MGGGLSAIVGDGKEFERCGVEDTLVALNAVFVISILCLEWVERLLKTVDRH